MAEALNHDEHQRHTSDIVSAYVRNNRVDATQLGDLIRTVHTSLARLGPNTVPEVGPLVPAVPIKRSVQPHQITCLECGWQGKMLRRHLTTGHNMTPDQYRNRWSLTREYPLTSRNYSEARSDLAKRLGLGRGGRGSPEMAQTPAPETETGQTPAPETAAAPPAAESAKKPARRGRPRTGAAAKSTKSAKSAEAAAATG